MCGLNVATVTIQNPRRCMPRGTHWAWMIPRIIISIVKVSRFINRAFDLFLRPKKLAINSRAATSVVHEHQKNDRDRHPQQHTWRPTDLHGQKKSEGATANRKEFRSPFSKAHFILRQLFQILKAETMLGKARHYRFTCRIRHSKAPAGITKMPVVNPHAGRLDHRQVRGGHARQAIDRNAPDHGPPGRIFDGLLHRFKHTRNPDFTQTSYGLTRCFSVFFASNHFKNSDFAEVANEHI